MRTDLKALFWKEGRENLRWVTLILLCLSAGLVDAAYSEAVRTPYNNSGNIPVWNSANLILTIAAPLAGLALGLLQILPELRRDQWAFLMHRPATRTTQFFGKVIPGLCLYLLAVSLPLLGLAAWDAAPGHVAAPFDFRFTLSGWAAILTGLPFYFAGLLTALRPARWFGSRPLPIIAALTGPIAAASWYAEFWQAALFSLASAAVFCLAAWGNFAASGDYESQPKTARFALGAIAYAGVLGVAIALCALIVAVSETLFPRPDSAYRYTQYQIDVSDAIVRVTQDRSGNPIKVTDSMGRPNKVPALSGGFWTGERFLQVASLTSSWGWHPGRHSAPDRYTDPAQYALPLETFQSRAGDTTWYYLYDAHQAVGYSERTRLPVAYLGPLGFSSTSAGAGRFSEPLVTARCNGNVEALLQFPHFVYDFDTQKETLVKLWPDMAAVSSPLSEVEGACYLTGTGRLREGNPVAVAAEHRIQVFSDTGDLVLDIPRAYAPSVYPAIAAAINPDSHRLYFWYAAKDSSPPNVLWSPSKIVTVNVQGQTLQANALPALDARPNTGATPAVTGALLPPSLIAAYAADKSALAATGDLNARRAWYGFRQDAGLGGVLALSALLGLFAAALAWLICRRCGDAPKNRLLWAFGVFWLGGYGVLLLLALRAWPARVVCLNCGRLRVVSHALCEHCGAQFARPVRDGTEIFEEMSV